MTLHPDPIHFVSALERAPGGEKSLAKASHIPPDWLRIDHSLDYDAYRNRAKALRAEALRDAGLALSRRIRTGFAAIGRLFAFGGAADLDPRPR